MSGLVLYARVDGSFAVWDPLVVHESSAPDPSGRKAFLFGRDEVWLGDSNRIEGLLRDWMERLVRADRLLAQVALDEAAASGVNPAKLAEDLEELAKGDRDRDEEKFDRAIDHYRKAWGRSIKLRIRWKPAFAFVDLPPQKRSVSSAAVFAPSDWIS